MQNPSTQLRARKTVKVNDTLQKGVSLILTSSFNTVAEKLARAIPFQFQGKRVAFVPTAADPYTDRSYLYRDRESLERLGCEVHDVDLKGKNGVQLKREFDLAEIIFVGGGNVLYLAEQMRRSGFMDVIRSLLATRDYIGSSAGSILLGPSVEPFYEEDINDLPKDFVCTSSEALGLVPYIVMPHANNPQFAEGDEKIMERFGTKYELRSLRDDEYLVEQTVS